MAYTHHSALNATISGFVSERDLDEQTRPQTYTELDGENAMKCLRKCFQVHQPGNHVARIAEESGTSIFIHCKHTAQVGRQYLALRRILEERARHELLRDCLFRIKAAAMFVNVLQQLVEEESKVWYLINHDSVNEIPDSKIFCLNALCEDLRITIGHWNCIKQKLHTNRWLQPVLGSMYFQLDQVRIMLNSVQDKAIWWLEKFVLVGLQVFAHGHVDKLTPEMISNVTRGLEDMNNIISGLQKRNASTSKHNLSSISGIGHSYVGAEETNTFSKLGKHVKALPVARVLNILANERAKYSAMRTHRFFTTNHEFVKLLYSGKLPNYVWTEDISSHVNETLDRETSDYHTGTGSMTSLSASILKVGNVTVPDLSNADSPLVELERRELKFAEKFLLIACNSTNLLRKKGVHKSRQDMKPGQNWSSLKHSTAETPFWSRNNSLRKSVSWGDSADRSITSQQIARYMDLYWNHLGTNLFLIFYEPSWSRPISLYSSHIGNVVTLNTAVVAIIKQMMQHVCLKDLFPTGSVTPIMNAATKCLHIAALGAWDTYMCQSLTSHRSDKCYPCPLVNGDTSTQTCMLIRDTYMPLAYLLEDQLAERLDPSIGGLHDSLSLMFAVGSRLVSTSNLALQWCQSKIQQYLASMSVGNFLLISQGDLKVLVDETRTSLHQLQMVCKTLSMMNGEDLVENHCTSINQLSVLLDSLQGLSDVCMKQFSRTCFNNALQNFKSHMPTGKAWRIRSDEMPKEHNIYIEHALEKILQPILDDAEKFKRPIQLGVLSIAIESVCQAWMAFILQEKIKFSFAGACQYGLDVKYMHTWLQKNIAMETVRLCILDLPVLKTLGGIVLLLKKQPSKMSSTKFIESGSMWNQDNRLHHLQEEWSACENNTQISHVQNPNDWLALRVQGGASIWRGIFACLNPDPQS